MTAQTRATRIADYLLHEREQRRFFLNVRSDTDLPPLPHHYQYKNLIGVAYPYSDAAAAKAWIIGALMAGHYVFRTRARERWSLGYGFRLDEEPSDFLHDDWCAHLDGGKCDCGL